MLDKKAAGIVCVVLAILNKTIIALAFSSLKGDKALYLLFAQSYLETGKLTVPVSTIENGSTFYLFDPAVYSPLYSLVATPVLWLTGSFFITQFIISVFAWVMVYVALYQLTLALFRQRWLAHLFIFCSGFFLYPHELSSTPKDTLALGLVLWSIVVMNKFFIHPSKTRTCLLALTLSGLVLVKLMYVPLMVALLFLFTLFLFLERKKALLLHLGLLIGLLVLTGFCVQQFLFEPAYHAAANQTVHLPRNQNIVNRGFYPENLLHTYPFISSSIINTELWGVQVEKATSLSFSDFIRWLFRLDVALFVVLFITTLVHSRQIIANRSWFFVIGSAFVMIAVALGLSASEELLVYKSSNNTWTYAADSRSFLVPIMAIQLALFAFVFRYRKLALIRVALFCLFLFECLHGIYFTAKQSVHTDFTTESNVENDALQQITTMIEKNEKRPALVTSDNFLRRYAQVKNLKAYAFSDLKADFSWMKKGDVYLLATHAGDSAYLQKFPLENLIMIDTIKPFVLHRFEVK